jgi:hypothetical protein
MKSVEQISELRNCGFYELKKLLGLGDERLKMILKVGNLKPIRFGKIDGTKVDELYPLFMLKKTLQELQGRDVEEEYRRLTELEKLDPETRKKLEDVKLRLLNRQNRKNEK